MFGSSKDYAKYACWKFRENRQKFNRLRLIFNGSKWDVILAGFSRIMRVHFGGKSICNKHEEDVAQFFSANTNEFSGSNFHIGGILTKNGIIYKRRRVKNLTFFHSYTFFFVHFDRTKAPENSLTKRFFHRRRRFKRNSSCESIKISIEIFFTTKLSLVSKKAAKYIWTIHNFCILKSIFVSYQITNLWKSISLCWRKSRYY